jgi:ADP-heptose:LPS heptosyltransferase
MGVQGPSDSGRGRWRRRNAGLYRVYGRVRAALCAPGVSRLVRGFARAGPALAGPPPTLYLSWGRLGDTILQSGFTQHYRQWLGAPVVAVGRPEAGPLLRQQVDRFVALDPAALHSRRARRVFLAAIPRECGAVLGDVHLFHGGDLLAGLLDAVPAQRRFCYRGWADADAVAPARRLPARAQIVPSLPKTPCATDPEAVHVFSDLMHYHGAVRKALDQPAPAPADVLPRLPTSALDGNAARSFGLRPFSYVACQPASSQGKKDYPTHAFHDVIAAFPRLTFALLGTAADAAGCRLGGLGNVVDLRGRTSVLEAVGLCAAARAFAGVDSGLAHAAATAGTPTVVAMPASSLGYFFPYPAALGRTRVTAVWHEGYRACAGCLGLCEHEPLWQSRRRGFPCLRELSPTPVIAALQRRLEDTRDRGHDEVSLGAEDPTDAGAARA